MKKTDRMHMLLRRGQDNAIAPPEVKSGGNLHDIQREAKHSLINDKAMSQMQAKPLSRAKLLLARFSIFDFFKNKPYLLAKRPFSVVSLLNSGAKELRCQLKIETTAFHTERGAVIASAKFYNWYGREISHNALSADTHELFADPIGDAVLQPCYYAVPPGARWAKVFLERTVPERRISVHGRLRLRKFNNEMLSFDDVIKSRDCMQLRQHLDRACMAFDRGYALSILGRLVFLKRSPADIQSMKVISDIEQTLTSLSSRNATPSAQPGSDTYEYTETFTQPWDGHYPLSKWLMREVTYLRSNAGHSALHLSNGPNVLLRAMAAALSGNVISSIPTQESAVSINWVKVDEVFDIINHQQASIQG